VKNKVYYFEIDDAEKYGVDEAVMLQNIRYWVDKNAANGENIRDGRAWTYNSARALALLFPFWSIKQVQRVIRNLEEKGAIIKGTYNKHNYDKTSWYTTVENPLYTISPNEAMDYPKQDNGLAQTGQSISPNGITDTILKTHIKNTNEKQKYGAQHIDAAEYLANKILENNSKHTQLQEKKYKDTVNRYADDIRKMNDIDGFNLEEIKDIIDFSQSDKFWSQHILSAKKLRDKANQLIMKMKNKTNTRQDKQQAFLSEAQKLYNEYGDQ
jgi:hypothetical protein